MWADGFIEHIKRQSFAHPGEWFYDIEDQLRLAHSYSYSDVAGFEWAEHQFDIALNDLGATWLANLKVMEAAEILVVGSAERCASLTVPGNRLQSKRQGR
ncbi:MAG: hypothetical protein QM608_07655 [Caulobacter sp.]